MVECCTFGLPNHDHPFHQTPRLVPQNFNIVCWIVQSIWALPQTETWGPKRPISQYLGHLDLIWGGGDYGVVATPELLVDIYLSSEKPRSPGNCLDVPIYFKLSRPFMFPALEIQRKELCRRVREWAGYAAKLFSRYPPLWWLARAIYTFSALSSRSKAQLV